MANMIQRKKKKTKSLNFKLGKKNRQQVFVSGIRAKEPKAYCLGSLYPSSLRGGSEWSSSISMEAFTAVDEIF